MHPLGNIVMRLRQKMQPKWDTKGRERQRAFGGLCQCRRNRKDRNTRKGGRKGERKGEDFTFGMNETFDRLSELWQSSRTKAERRPLSFEWTVACVKLEQHHSVRTTLEKTSFDFDKW